MRIIGLVIETAFDCISALVALSGALVIGFSLGNVLVKTLGLA